MCMYIYLPQSCVYIQWHSLSLSLPVAQLDDKPIQHREVMNYESELFKGYFKTIKLLEGG